MSYELLVSPKSPSKSDFEGLFGETKLGMKFFNSYLITHISNKLVFLRSW